MDLTRLDKRWVYLLLLLAVGIPLLVQVELPVRLTSETEKVFNAVESIDSTGFVMLSFDIEASSLPEVRPIAEALLRHLFERNLKVIGLALFPEGTAIGYDLMRKMAEEYDKKYGEDYLYLGYRPQYVSAILQMGEDIRSVYPLDYLNADWTLSGPFSMVRNYDDIELVISVADGSLPTYWVEYAGARHGQKIATGLTAVMATSYYPYTESGQLVGLIGGLKGAAEYEQLLGYVGGGQRGMLAQSSGHLLIIVLVLLVNIVAFRRRD